MKRIVYCALALFFLVLSNTATSQANFTFRVMANKGMNKIKKSSGQEIPLRTGATLDAADQLIVSEGAYIGLMHNSGRTIEVRTPGTMSVSDLEGRVNTGTSSVASRYSAYINQKMDEEQSGTYRSRLAATGAVSRAVADGTISLFLENSDGSAKFLDDNAVIRWEAPKDSATYVLTVTNLMDQVLLQVETTETSVELDFAEQLQDELGYNTFIIKVADKNDESIASNQDGIAIKRITEDEELMQELEALKAEISEDTPLGRLILASFFEEKGLLLDALTQYEAAIEMAPDIPDFQELYDNFLYVNRFKELEEE